MEHNYNDIDELFQSSFENFEVEPPSELKAIIDKQIKFKSKRKFGRIWLFGILAIGLLSCVILFFTIKDSRTNLAQTKMTEKIESTRENNVPSDHQNFRGKQNPSHNLQKQDSSGPKTIEEKEVDSKNKQSLNLKSKNPKSQPKILAENKSSSSKNSSNFNLNPNIKVKQKNLANSKNKNTKKRKNISDIKSNEFNSKFEENSTILGEKNHIENQLNDSEKATIVVSREDSIKKDALTKDTTSIITANVANKIESSQHHSSSETSPKDRKNIPLLLSFKADYNLPFNKNTTEESFSAKKPFHFQLEASYLFNSKFGATSGFNYFSSSQTFSKTTMKIDSLFTGITYDPIFADSLVYVYDSNLVIIDSSYVSYIIDSTAQENFEILNSSSTKSNSFTFSSFSLPILFYYNQKLSDKIYLDLNAGAILNFQKIKFTDASNPLNSDLTLSKTGIKAILKTSLRYQFSHLGVSLNNNFLYDFAPTQSNSGKRKVMSWGVGVGVSWRF